MAVAVGQIFTREGKSGALRQIEVIVFSKNFRPRLRRTARDVRAVFRSGPGPLSVLARFSP